MGVSEGASVVGGGPAVLFVFRPARPTRLHPLVDGLLLLLHLPPVFRVSFASLMDFQDLCSVEEDSGGALYELPARPGCSSSRDHSITCKTPPFATILHVPAAPTPRSQRVETDCLLLPSPLYTLRHPLHPLTATSQSSTTPSTHSADNPADHIDEPRRVTQKIPTQQHPGPSPA